MPTITVSDKTYARVRAFLPLGSYLAGEELPVDLQAEALIVTGIRSLLERLWTNVAGENPGVLIQSLLKLVDRHPAEVCQFVVDVLLAGEEAQRKAQQEAEYMGFHPNR